jgi:hypothetical protein
VSARDRRAKQSKRRRQRRSNDSSTREKHTEEDRYEAGEAPSADLAAMPEHRSSSSIRQKAFLHLQQQHVNAYMQRLIAGRQPGFGAERIQREDEAETSPGGPPILEETGIGTKVAIDRFTAAAKTIKDDWDKLATGKKRATALGEVGVAELEKAGVPATKIRVKNMFDAGQFDFESWSLDLGKKGFEKATMTDAEINDAADTVFHESRHAEQWFRMAQLMASKGKSATQIKKKMSIPLKVAQAAVDSPLKSDSPQKAGAESWYESVYGAKSPHREKTLANLTKFGKRLKKAKQARSKVEKSYKKLMKRVNKYKKDLETAKDSLISAEVAYVIVPEGSDKSEKRKLKAAEKRVKLAEALASNAEKYGKNAETRLKKADELVKKARAKYNKVFKAYKNLPEESDAWKIGSKVTATMEAIDEKGE